VYQAQASAKQLGGKDRPLFLRISISPSFPLKNKGHAQTHEKRDVTKVRKAGTATPCKLLRQ